MSKSKSLPQILATIGKPVFTPNEGHAPDSYAADQMKGRGDAFSIGQQRETGRKLIGAAAVNGYAFLTLWRCKLPEAAKDDVMGYQVVAYDLAGNVLHASPLDDTAPKSKEPGWKLYRAVLADITAQGDTLLYVAAKSQYDAGEARQAELRELVELLAPEVAPADAPEVVADPA